MKRIYAIFLCILLLVGGGSANAQTRSQLRKQKKAEAAAQKAAAKSPAKPAKPAAQAATWQERIFMEYYVEPQGDTVYLEELPAAVVFPKIKRNSNDPDLRKYVRLVYNFNKVYPYTDVVKTLLAEADRNISGQHMNKIQKDRYVSKLQDQILDDFTGIVKNMTVSQGKLLTRLVDRETEMTAYEIIKSYKSGLAAGFWQGVAKLFDQSLKTPYDPDGEDRMTEYLIQKWEAGQFDALYYSIFMEWPTMVVVPSKYEKR